MPRAFAPYSGLTFPARTTSRQRGNAAAHPSHLYADLIL